MIYIQNKTTGEVYHSSRGVWEGFEKVSDKVGKVLYAEHAKRDLLKVLKPGDTVYCVLRHVSASGMSRRISFMITTKDDKGAPRIRDITHNVAHACGYTLSKGHGLVVGGCGMDMGFSVVYDLGATLWPNGTKKPHGMRNGDPDSAGGYALKYAWL